MKSPDPPRLAARILAWVTAPEEREIVLGDLAEEFRSVRVPRSGIHAARRWYWSQVLRSVWPLFTFSWAREGWGMTGFGKDVIGAIRVFRRAPAFALVVVLTVGIGVGGATAVFSVVRGVVLSPLSFPDSERVVAAWGLSDVYPQTPLTTGDFNEIADGIDAFEHFSGSWGNNSPLLDEREPEQVRVGWVSPNYFAMLQVHPLHGRTLGKDDLSAILISHALWQRRYGGDASVVGRQVQLGPQSMEIAGVLPSGIDPNLTTIGGERTEYQVWRLMAPGFLEGDDRSVGWIRSAARLRDGVTLQQAQAEVDAFMVRMNTRVLERDGGQDLRLSLSPVRADLLGALSRTLWIMLGAVSGVLLIAASNVAHLMLGRTEERADEVAVRAALGGGRTRLARQFVVESGVLALVGGLLGLGVARLGIVLLLRIAPPGIPRLETVHLDSTVMLFGLLATGVAALVFGVVPALRASRADLAQVLGERRSTAGRRQQRLSSVLVVAEVALSLGLLAGTGLMLRSLGGLERVDLGFETEGVLTFSMATSNPGTTFEEARTKLLAQIDRIEAIPGVASAGLTNRVPLGGGLFTGDYRSDDAVANDGEKRTASIRFITPGYLESMGARVEGGRDFLPEDGLELVLVDQLVAERNWPGEDPVGRRVELSAIGEDPAFAEVIGVVAPMKHGGISREASETLFLPMLARANQQNFRYMAVRVSGDPVAYLEPIRAAVRELDATMVVAGVRSMSALYDDAISPTRFVMMILAIFGGVALVLAAVGLYGVISATVLRRSREFGIRVALGAARAAILRSVVVSAGRLVLLGIGIGTILSLWLGDLLRTTLYEIGPGDPVALGGAALVMGLVGLFGAYLPARAIMSVDPASALREE